MLTITEYNEPQDTFTVFNENAGTTFSIDASTLADLLNCYDEPREFIGLTFTVQVQV